MTTKKNERTTRTDVRDQRAKMREYAAQDIRTKEEQKQRRKLQKVIVERLLEIPESWKARYYDKLREHGINVRSRVQHVNSLNSLQKRVDLLPPPTSYQHHRNSRHPSQVEKRATRCKSFKHNTRDYVARHCTNNKILSPNNGMWPEHIRRFSPKNIVGFDVDGEMQCLTTDLLKFYHKNGYTFDQTYQQDTKNNNWPEMLVDADSSRRFRLPFHVASQCGVDLKYPADTTKRRKPPHQSTYA